MSHPASQAASLPEPSGRGLRGRLADEINAGLVILGLKVLCWLPERVVWNLADAAGNLGYLLSPGRRTLARRNLRRVVEWMAANGLGDESHRAAASDPKALERLVHAAFRHNAAYYVELARITRFTAAWLLSRMVVETPDEVAEWRSRGGAQILVGMHFGAIELPGLYAVAMLGHITAPMETVANARIQRYVLSIRATTTVRILSLDQAGIELLAALRRGEPVGIVADRDLTHAGVEMEFFGARTKIPGGPALLAIETGAPMYVAAVRRAGHGRYRGRLQMVPEPVGASRRERSRSMVREETSLFERMISDSPEQWLAIFHPIWPDLDGSILPADPGAGAGSTSGGGSTAGGAA